MFQLFNNIPNVTKNILILNVLFFMASWVMIQNELNPLDILGGHYVNSPLFKPYQVITHFFMHSPTDIFHILFNMIMLVMLGSHLERIWGPKRFFIFYIISAIGSFALYNAIGVFQLMELKNQLEGLGFDTYQLNVLLEENNIDGINQMIQNYASNSMDASQLVSLIEAYAPKVMTAMVGASGAIFGIMAAFAYLFPNTEFMLLFPPIPLKAKYFVGIYFIFEVYLGFKNVATDNVAHFAHVGGAIAGFITVFIWNKQKDRFY